ncbi:MAG: DnaA/Hda family protein [Trichlorobacter sp.]|uniref:DnaA/Hda family protein n=1 Tax=Trichlorobacter sp. TaxID=2911007 RepID=UPI00255F34DF|nr:DnaA/Hda family protein [Trichlorobacter sp.]MDK9718529.1 DnaA/Hda family protein [Trichlorobacter sp.]
MIDTYLRPGFTFGQFACGSCNQLAYSSTQAAATGNRATFNPLIIYGASGLGKSHLLHAAGHQFVASNPTKRVICCTADAFTQALIDSLRTNQPSIFRDTFGSADLLLLDNVQSISQKERSQQELQYLHDRLADRQVQIVLTFDQHPSRIKGIAGHLQSWFSGGMIVELLMPDYETKRLILDTLAFRHRVKLLDDVADFLASIDVTSIKELEGMMIRLGAYSSLQNVEVTLPLAIKCLHDVICI